MIAFFNNFRQFFDIGTGKQLLLFLLVCDVLFSLTQTEEYIQQELHFLDEFFNFLRIQLWLLPYLFVLLAKTGLFKCIWIPTVTNSQLWFDESKIVALVFVENKAADAVATAILLRLDLAVETGEIYMWPKIH